MTTNATYRNQTVCFKGTAITIEVFHIYRAEDGALIGRIWYDWHIWIVAGRDDKSEWQLLGRETQAL